MRLLESAGASLGFGASVHTVSFCGRSLVEDLPMLLNLLSESLRHPVFPAEQIERLRAQLLTGLAIRAQDTAEMASLTFDETLFANHPYGRPEDGYPGDHAGHHPRGYRRVPPAPVRPGGDGGGGGRGDHARNRLWSRSRLPWAIGQIPYR